MSQEGMLDKTQERKKAHIPIQNLTHISKGDYMVKATR